MLREHGVQLMRSEPLNMRVTISDPTVEVAGRQALDGSHFFFVRTEDRTVAHRGRAEVQDAKGGKWAFHFQLEPFGSRILYLPSRVTDAEQGEWLPKLEPLPRRPPTADLPFEIPIREAERFPDMLPTSWTALSPGGSLERLGVMDRHFLYYRVAVPGGKSFTVARIGDRVVNASRADGVLAFAAGHFLREMYGDKDGVTFEMPADANEAIVLFESPGLPHHTNPLVEKFWNVGARGLTSEGGAISTSFAGGERERGETLSNPRTSAPANVTRVAVGEAPTAASALLTWYRLKFELPVPKPGVWVSWSLHLEAEGNGFLYLNGHCLGRYWQNDPPPGGSHVLKAQRDFYLPESWLNFGPGKANVLALSLRPVAGRVQLRAAAVRPLVDFAETRP